MKHIRQADRDKHFLTALLLVVFTLGRGQIPDWDRLKSNTPGVSNSMWEALCFALDCLAFFHPDDCVNSDFRNLGVELDIYLAPEEAIRQKKDRKA